MQAMNAIENTPPTIACWLCNSPDLRLIKSGAAIASLQASDIAITDLGYGQTCAIYECQSCRFKHCPEVIDMTPYYAAMEDPEYQETAPQRIRQAKHLLKYISGYKSSGDLLDVGAGSGILVAQALQKGYRASGIDPSASLVKQAQARNLPVTQGTLSNHTPQQCYDIITLMDVVEHVVQPLTLLTHIASRLKPDGLLMLTTPDVSSLAAGYLCNQWWHYRIAHISYFNRQTLAQALDKAGLRAIAWHRPRWYFSLEYLLQRVGHYMPWITKWPLPSCLKNCQIPLNFYDSWLVIAEKKP